jgi:hypothetical protein
MRTSRLRVFVALFLVMALQGQQALNNETVVKLIKAGLGEEIVLGMINQQPGKYSLSADDLVALKQAGASDKIIAAMMSKNAASPAPPAPTPAASASAPAGMPSEIGVYYKKAEAWSELLPEVVNWKTGGAIKSIASAGIVKKDVNGNVTGPNSRNVVKSPLQFLIYAAEGTAVTEYQLLKLRPNKGYREFRTVTGGVFNQRGGAIRDLVPFEGKKIATRTFMVDLPNLGPGEYGFLPPGAVMSSGASSSLGKMYTFRLLE